MPTDDGVSEGVQVIVMGVSGSGKSTIGALIAGALRVPLSMAMRCIRSRMSRRWPEARRSTMRTAGLGYTAEPCATGW
jgi:ABC-type thiamine transport system ATPase subunit